MTQPRLGYPSPVDEFAPEEVALRPRDAKFGWDETPLHWMPGDPYGSHATTALNLFLPVAERWFAKLLTEALDYVRDERLREQIIGFIGQEAIHARTHDDVLVEFVRRHGIDPPPRFWTSWNGSPVSTTFGWRRFPVPPGAARR